MLIPPELTDIIASNLVGDISTLASCSLVSRRWSAAARPILFHNLIIRGHDEGRGFEDLNRFLASPLQGVTHFVKELSLDGSPRLLDYSGVPSRLNHHLLGSILSNLPNLKSLYLTFLVWTRAQDAPMSLQRKPTALQWLAISTVRFIDQLNESIPELFSLFSTVDHLRVALIATPDDLLVPSEKARLDLLRPGMLPSTPDFHLKRLTYQARSPFLHAIRVLNAPSALVFLEIHHDSQKTITATQDLVRDTGSALTFIRIRLAPWPDFPFDDIQMVDLSYCTSLQVICVNLLLFEKRVQKDFGLAIDILSHVRRDIHTITLELELRSGGSQLLSQMLDDLDWHRMDHLLRTFRGLDVFSVVLIHNWVSRIGNQTTDELLESAAQSLEEIKRRLPDSCARGLVQLSQEYVR